MTRLRIFTRRRPTDPELAAAKRHVAASRRRAESEYRTSVKRLADSQQVAQVLAAHNQANRYGDFLEQIVSRGAR